MRKVNEASSLKSLASNVLEKLQRNKRETVLELPVARSVSSDSQNGLLQLSSLPDEYEERLAIAEYDGHQSATQAQRIAYLDAFIAVLVTLPRNDGEGDWLNQRVKAAQKWLEDQGMSQPK